MEINSPNQQSNSAPPTSFQDTSNPITNSRSNFIIILGVVILLLSIVGIGTYYLRIQRNQSKTQFQQTTVVPTTASTIFDKNLDKNIATLTTNTRLSFSIPKNWGGKFYKNTKEDLRVELSDWVNSEIKDDVAINPPTNYIQIEILTPTLPTTNKYITTYSSQDIIIGGFTFKKITGKETFSTKGRDFQQFSWNYKSQKYLLNAYSPNISQYENQIQNVLKSIAKGLLSNNNSFIQSLIKNINVYAQDGTTESTTASSKFKDIKFLELIPEAEPMQAQFTGQPQGYSFTALVGQRLTTIAEEDYSSHNYSYIKSDLYDENGDLVKGELQTRIEFIAPYTGKYYLIVQSFGKGDEKYQVRLQDRDQSDIVIKIKRYNDGAEFFFPPEVGIASVPFADFAFLVNLNKVADPSTVKPQVFASSGAKEQFQTEASFPEDSEVNLVKITSLLLENGAILVEPDTKQFPKSSQIVLHFPLGSELETAGGTAGSFYISRIFTE